ncbi:MAG TPA: fluoride efflux transporter CrcB [Actinopolymorphaceae bacterium]|nr:fluoride efflux transporter CrcB [Actinopolymorphaceae bacterium]
MTVVLAVALGGLVGAPLRYHLDRFVQARHGSVFPWGTLVVNLTGCFVLGVLAAAGSADVVGGFTSALLGVGVCGALTTYSTFGYETLRLVEDGARLPAVANVVVSVFAGLGAAIVGLAVGGAVWPVT